MLTDISRQRCDRAQPACGTCINRGGIADCKYGPRKRDSRTVLSRSDLPTAFQSRINQLENLVLSLFKAHQESRGQLDALTSCVTNDHEDFQDNAARPNRNHVVGSDTTIHINAEYKQCPSYNEAHWALLLSEVCHIRVRCLVG